MNPTAIRFSSLVVNAPDAPRGSETRILGPIDVSIETGAYVLLVGPSGGGKTTFLRAIAGLQAPSAGTLELFGERASDGARLRQSPASRGVGMLFQGGALWPHMSVERTLRFAMRAAKLRPRAGRVQELLELVDLGGLADRMPATLSGGQRQRLALARALACEPRILLLDEPLGPLDTELRSSLAETLASLHRSLGWTTIHVTHDPAEAAAAATRTLRIASGLLAEPGNAATDSQQQQGMENA